MARKYRSTVGPEARAGWKEEWSWKDKKGVWRKRTIYGTGVAKLDAPGGAEYGASEFQDPGRNRDYGQLEDHYDRDEWRRRSRPGRKSNGRGWR